MKRISGAVLGLLVAAFAVSLSASPAFPANKDIWPVKFALSSGNSSMAEAQATARQTFDWLSGHLEEATFFAPVSLPVGSSVTRLGFHAYSATTTTVRVSLKRSKIGTTELVAETEKVGSYVPQWIMEPLPAAHAVQAGWKYWVELYISSGGVLVYGVRLGYNP